MSTEKRYFTEQEDLERFYRIVNSYLKCIMRQGETDSVDFIELLSAFLNTSKVAKKLVDLQELMIEFGKWRNEKNKIKSKSGAGAETEEGKLITRISGRVKSTFWKEQGEHLGLKANIKITIEEFVKKLLGLESCMCNFMIHFQNAIKKFNYSYKKDTTHLLFLRREPFKSSKIDSDKHVFDEKDVKLEEFWMTKAEIRYVLDVLFKEGKTKDQIENAKLLMSQMQAKDKFRILTLCHDNSTYEGKRIGCVILEKCKQSDAYEIALMCFDVESNEAQHAFEWAVSEYEREFDILKQNGVYKQRPKKRKR